MKALQWPAEVGGGYVYAYFWYGRPTPVEVWTRPEASSCFTAPSPKQDPCVNDFLQPKLHST
eukprot:scaffold48316_cov72-Cyclotella_meneghiniana.AAC.1